MGARWTLIGGGAVTVLGVAATVMIMQLSQRRRMRQPVASLAETEIPSEHGQRHRPPADVQPAT